MLKCHRKTSAITILSFEIMKNKIRHTVIFQILLGTGKNEIGDIKAVI